MNATTLERPSDVVIGPDGAWGMSTSVDLQDCDPGAILTQILSGKREYGSHYAAQVSSHLARWLRRYLPSELLSLLAAVAGAQLAYGATANPAVAAVAGAWSETIIYYATMLTREVRAHPGQRLPITLRNLVLEFGLAEALDSLLIRPAMMYAATQLLANIALGTVLGKFAADVVFYIPTIAAYELRRRYLPAWLSPNCS